MHLSTWPWDQPPDTICLEEPGLVDKDQDRVESLGMLTISWVTSDKQGFLLRTSAVRHPEYNKILRYAKMNKINTCMPCILHKSYPNKVQTNIYLVKKQKKDAVLGILATRNTSKGITSGGMMCPPSLSWATVEGQKVSPSYHPAMSMPGDRNDDQHSNQHQAPRCTKHRHK